MMRFLRQHILWTDSRPFNPLTLAFTRQWAGLETEFRNYNFKESLVRVRIAISVALFFYGIFGILDYVMVPDKKTIFWAIRYLVVIPLALGVLAFSFRPLFKSYAQPLLFIMCLTGGLGIVLMVALADPPATYSYYAGIILIFITIHTFLNMQFLWATACSWTIVAVYEIAAIGIMDTPFIILINNNFFFISAVAICMLAGYTMELNARYRFLSAHMLALEKDKVVQANKTLDQRVRERTRALSEANRRLKEEMVERMKTQARQLKLEKELSRQRKMEAIGTLAGGIAHDFNNILSAIIGYTELAMEDDDPEDRRSDHSEILKAARRAKELIAQIRAFSRQSEQEAGPIKLGPVVEEALKLLKASIPSSVAILSRLASKRRVIADSTQIHRIMVNLCTNAVQAMDHQRGTLEIVLEDIELDALFETNKEGLDPGPYVKLSISDTGRGMTEEVREKIFDPFFTTKAVDEGTGMGLSVVHGIVKQYRGSIRVYSEPGKGTTFNILFPATPIEEGEAPQPASPITGGNESIVVLDDEPPLARMLDVSLSALGYRVAAFSDADQALAYVKSNGQSIDLVLTDYSMPKMNGIEFAEQILSLTRGCPVILCTGYSENVAREKMNPANIRAFLMKPLIRHSLANSIRRVLDRHKAGDHDAVPDK